MPNILPKERPKSIHDETLPNFVADGMWTKFPIKIIYTYITYIMVLNIFETITLSYSVNIKIR